MDLLNLGGGQPSPQQEQPPAPSSISNQTYFDLMNSSAGTGDQLLDFTSGSTNQQAPSSNTQSNGVDDLLGGFDTMTTSSTPSNADLLRPQAAQSGNISSHASSTNSLVDDDFMNFMGTSNPEQMKPTTTHHASSSDNLLGDFSTASMMAGGMHKNPSFGNTSHIMNQPGKAHSSILRLAYLFSKLHHLYEARIESVSITQ